MLKAAITLAVWGLRVRTPPAPLLSKQQNAAFAQVGDLFTILLDCSKWTVVTLPMRSWSKPGAR